jgi:hypothetical protein
VTWNGVKTTINLTLTEQTVYCHDFSDYRRVLEWWLHLLDYLTQRATTLYSTMLHTHIGLPVSTVTSSLPLLGSDFRRRRFPFLWVPELPLASATDHNWTAAAVWLAHKTQQPTDSLLNWHDWLQQSQCYVTTDGQSASLSGAYDQIFIIVWRLQACWCEALSLTRGRVCHLPESQSAVVSLLSVCTIYISHVIKNVYICMYVYKIYTRPLSVQAQYRRSCPIICCSCYNGSLVTWTTVRLTTQKTAFLCCCAIIAVETHTCLRNRYLAAAVVQLLISQSLPSKQVYIP